MNAKADCIFCSIVAGRAPAAKVAESEHALAFLDLFPTAEGHTLVIPKTHYDDLLGADDTTLADVHRLARRVALAIDAALAPDGLMVLQLNRAPAGQTVFHYHAHVVPRAAGSELRLHGRQMAQAAALDALAARIAAALPD